MNVETIKYNLFKAKSLLSRFGEDARVNTELSGIITSIEKNDKLLVNDFLSASSLLNISMDRLAEERLSSEEIQYALNSLTNKLGESNFYENSYQVNPKSFARKKTLITISKYFDMVMGEGFVNRIHNQLGISRSDLGLEEHNDKISPTLVMDFFLCLLQTKIDPSVFNFMAKTQSLKAVPKGIHRDFEGLNATQSMELFTNVTLKGNFDNLFEYKFLSAKEDKLLVEVLPVRDNHSLYSNEIIGNKALCKYKIGVFESFLNISGLETVTFHHESSCLYEGGSSCQYHFQVLSPLQLNQIH